MGLPSLETARGFCSAKNSLTCSRCASKCTALVWVGVLGSLLLGMPRVTTQRLPRGCGLEDFKEDLTGWPDFFRTRVSTAGGICTGMDSRCNSEGLSV